MCCGENYVIDFCSGERILFRFQYHKCCVVWLVLWIISLLADVILGGFLLEHCKPSLPARVMVHISFNHLNMMFTWLHGNLAFGTQREWLLHLIHTADIQPYVCSNKWVHVTARFSVLHIIITSKLLIFCSLLSNDTLSRSHCQP